MKRLSYTIPLAQEATGLSEHAIRSAIKSGDLPAKRVGNKIIILAESLLKWVHGMEAVSADEGGGT